MTPNHRLSLIYFQDGLVYTCPHTYEPPLHLFRLSLTAESSPRWLLWRRSRDTSPRAPPSKTTGQPRAASNQSQAGLLNLPWYEYHFQGGTLFRLLITSFFLISSHPRHGVSAGNWTQKPAGQPKTQTHTQVGYVFNNSQRVPWLSTDIRCSIFVSSLITKMF